MENFWITCFGIIFILTNHFAKGQSDVEVQLEVTKYVDKGSSVTMRCKHNVKPEILYKVTWLRDGYKFFEYINGRNPPYRNFSIPGASIDWRKSNEDEVTLKNIDFEAAGIFHCEVSTDTPIFTKASNEKQLHVILPQNNPPRISFSKRQFFIGEKLIANCTTSKARPAPHITWLINGKKVDDKYIKTFHYPSGGKNSHRSKSHLNNPSYDKTEMAADIYPRSSISSSKEEPLDNNGHSMGFEIHPNMGYENAYDGDVRSAISSSRDVSSESFDNRHLDSKKRRNAYTRKYRRHVNEGNRNVHKAIFSSSQLSVEVSDLHAGLNGRLEITCLATIPAHVGSGEQFADYKTYSVKIDIEQAETTSPVPQPAPLGNMSSNALTFTIQLLTLGLPLLLIIFHYKNGL